MEDIDGGLHPAVDGQSLDEDVTRRTLVQSRQLRIIVCGLVA